MKTEEQIRHEIERLEPHIEDYKKREIWFELAKLEHEVALFKWILEED